MLRILNSNRESSRLFRIIVIRGKPNEDPNNYLMDIYEIMNTFRYNGASDDAIYLRAFTFSLKDNAKK